MSSLSKIIKPYESKVFLSAKKFQKQPLAPRSPAAEKPEDSSSPQTGEPEPPVRPQPAPDDIIAEARRRAEQIVRDAEQTANRIRHQARREGRVDGSEEARKQMEEHLEASSRLLSSLAAQMKEQESRFIKTITPELVDVVTSLAQKVVHKELEQDTSLVTVQAEEAINRIVERERLIIRVNPEDGELMKYHKEALIRMFDGVNKIEVVTDTDVERGGCIVEADHIRVDAQPSSQIAAARKALHGEAQT
jgi:flagellar assembly protein FliH